ncbi:hypothetical protein S1OALGB6SA_34, partial [Olavius algarvensis spirochete endosymbiont]
HGKNAYRTEQQCIIFGAQPAVPKALNLHPTEFANP